MVVLFDAYGRYVDMEALREEKAGPTLTGVRQAFSDHPAQGLTPAKLARILLEAEQGDTTAYLELAEEMEEKDPHYASVLATRKRAVAGLEITVEAATDKPEDLEAADLVRDLVLNRDELREEIFHILDAVGKGYSVTEIVWTTGDSLWYPERLVWRDPRFFEFDRLGQDLLLKTENGPRPLDAYKYITHKSNSKSGLAIRGGLARPAAWFYLFKNYDIKSWVRFLEVFGLPLRLGKYGEGATESDKQTLLRAVRNIASDAAAIIPQSMMIEFLGGQASGEGTNSFLVFVEYIDRQISKLVLGQTGTTDTGQYVGTSDAHREVRDDIEVSDAVQLTATLNRDIVRPLVDLNLGSRKLYPRLKIAREKREDLTALVQHVTTLVPMGLKVEASVIRDKLGLPEPAEGAELLTAPAAMPMGGGFESDFNRAMNRADTWAEARADARADDWRPLTGPALETVFALAAECKNFEDFQSGLLKLMESGGLDMAALGEDLAGQMFMATLEGAGLK
ncbi:DUF935 domain-containing protein [Deltaproteobacteria bacterium Smac51]|nr:DUF935 domain-containing protein [Deltaproteobacteria bacterium Smac51]UQZ90518.1 DUF935 domain-containing protein [Deltaproteobacteria bacterium Smac51]